MPLDRTWYNTLVDDTSVPPGTNGSVWDKSAVDSLMDAVDASLVTVQTTTLTGTQNNFALSAGCTLLLCNNATLLTITGFVAGFAGQVVQIVSIGAGQVDLTNQGGGSTATNRIIQGITGSRSLAPGLGSATIVYDATTTRWRVMRHEQGATIAVSFSAGSFSAGAGTWVLTSPDVVTFNYLLDGSWLTITLSVTLTTITGTPPALVVAIPAGYFNGLSRLSLPCVGYTDAAGAWQTPSGWLDIAASGATIAIYTAGFGGTNWPNATNTVSLAFVISIPLG